MKINTKPDLLAIERVIQTLRRKRYPVTSLDIAMNSIEATIEIGFENLTKQKEENILNQLKKINEIK